MKHYGLSTFAFQIYLTSSVLVFYLFSFENKN